MFVRRTWLFFAERRRAGRRVFCERRLFSQSKFNMRIRLPPRRQM